MRLVRVFVRQVKFCHRLRSFAVVCNEFVNCSAWADMDPNSQHFVGNFCVSMSLCLWKNVDARHFWPINFNRAFLAALSRRTFQCIFADDAGSLVLWRITFCWRLPVNRTRDYRSVSRSLIGTSRRLARGFPLSPSSGQPSKPNAQIRRALEHCVHIDADLVFLFAEFFNSS